MTPPRLVAIVVAAAAAIVAIVLVVVVPGGRGAAGTTDGVTTPASFDLPALGGTGRVRLADHRGRPVVVSFFASWCTACRGELPGLARVRDETGGSVAFLAVDSMDGGDGLSFARGLGVGDWPLAKDVGGTLGSGLHDALGIPGLPVTAFYGASGRLLRVSPGAISTDALAADLRTLYGISVTPPPETPVPIG